MSYQVLNYMLKACFCNFLKQIRRFSGLSNRIGHDPFDGDAEASVTDEGGFQMGDCGSACSPTAVLFLVGGHAGKGSGPGGRVSVVRQAHQPSNLILTLRSRSSGVSSAFLCIFI